MKTIFLLLVNMLASVSVFAAPVTNVTNSSPTVWGGSQVKLNLNFDPAGTNTGRRVLVGSVIWDCATATLTKIIRNTNRSFVAIGTYEEGSGSSIEGNKLEAANFVGQVDGYDLTLFIYRSSKPLEPMVLDLKKGVDTSITRCL